MLVAEKQLEDWIGVDGTKELENLLRGCLVVDPKDRMSIKDIVNHPFFTTSIEEQNQVLINFDYKVNLDQEGTPSGGISIN